MTAPAFLLVHAGLGGLALLAAGLPVAARHRAVQVTAAAGLVCAGALYGLEDRWRTVDLSLPAARTVAVATGTAWLLVLVTDRGRGRWRTAALVGCASTGLLIAASNRWLVPLLVFWACSTFALVLVVRDARAPSLCRFSLIAGDALMLSALIASGQDAQEWVRPASLEGWQPWAATAGALLRGGAIPFTGIWGTFDTEAVPAVPLLVAGAFVLPLPSMAAQPWVAVGLLCAALVTAVWLLSRDQANISVVAAWPVLLSLATAFAASRAEAPAGVQAILATAAIALWPLTSGRGEVERGVLVSFAPPTAGFIAVALAASASFEAASRISGLSGSLPWAILVGLLPIGLLAGVLVGTRVCAMPEPEGFEPSAVLGVWALLAASMLIWLIPATSSAPWGGGGSWLQLGALAAALVAGIATRRWGRARPAAPGRTRHGLVVLEGSGASPRVAALASLVIGMAALATVVLFTIEGLRLGFLPG